MPDKTTPQTVPTMTAKHHFITAAIAAGIILVIALFIWIPFKLIPALFSTGSNYVATTLSSTLVPATSTPAATQNANTAAQTTTNNSTNANTANTNTSYHAPVAPSYYGMPDLAISLIGTGIISNGQFIETPYAGANDTIGIKFAVRNIGTNVSGPWTLRLTMPSRTTPNYDSGYQQSINPGDEMIFTASFDSPVAQGVNTGYITVDPLNLIQESNKFNNSLTVPITIEGTAYTNGYYGNSGYVNYIPTLSKQPQAMALPIPGPISTQTAMQIRRPRILAEPSTGLSLHPAETDTSHTTGPARTACMERQIRVSYLLHNRSEICKRSCHI